MEFNLANKYHLYNRAGFFVHHSEINFNKSLNKTVNEIVDLQAIKPLCMDIPKWNPKKHKSKSKDKRRKQNKKFREQGKTLNYIWFRQMIERDKGFLEKMTLFWHGHFACRTIHNPYLTMEMNNILRNNALGNFKELLFAVAKSASMIEYLHLRQNKKGKPNEDFARELCELFTLGRDIDYTEKDVSEIARAFTGWRTDEYGKFLVQDKLHDSGEKTIFGKTGNFGGEEVLNMILENKNTAKFIASKVYKFFVKEEIDKNQVEELAAVFYQSNYDISAMMKYLFKSDWFYESKGQLIKSPIGLLVGLGKMFDLKFEEKKTVLIIQHYLGQVLLHPPNVAGWAGGRHWIDASRFGLRIRLASLIINRGYVADELSPDLDKMLEKKQKRSQMKFYEEIDWNSFFEKNKDATIFELLIRNENEKLKAKNNKLDKKSVIHLLSSPDFQLI